MCSVSEAKAVDEPKPAGDEVSENCVFFGEPTGSKSPKGSVLYHCRMHGQCVLGRERGTAGCSGCRDMLDWSSPEFAAKWIDPLVVTDRRQRPVACLRGLLSGAPTFLVGGGPSANQVDLAQLSHRGIWSMAVNNTAGHRAFRPSSFVCSDPPQKFSHSIWLDPNILKFVPEPKLKGSRSRLRRKKPDGSFERIKQATSTCPNVWGFRRHSWLEPNGEFFKSDGALWGNHKAGAERTGQPRTVCTLLLGMRLLYYLGSRRIYLLGVDFRMRPDYGYSFGQARDEETSDSNNAQFAVVNGWLCEMQQNETFAKFGLEVYNCFAQSGLRAFPYVPFIDAVKDCKGEVEDEPDLGGWYDK